VASSLIQVSNDGSLITSTNYWTSDLAAAGKVWASVNAGAIRVLLPPARYGDLADMRASKYCVLSRGPWPAERKPEAIEIMWEDESDAPYVLRLSPESFDMLPAEPAIGREWWLSVWVEKDGVPHKSLERICHWRRVAQLPYMKAWGRTFNLASGVFVASGHGWWAALASWTSCWSRSRWASWRPWRRRFPRGRLG
jgi:hypothetical protein